MESGGGLGSLDELLHSKLYFAAVPCTFSDLETASISNKARNDVNELKAKRAKLKSDFVKPKGWRVVVSSDPQQPLFPAGFDPLNVTMLDTTEVLHRRWIKLSGEDGSVEILDHVSVTEAAGSHPLFNGVRRIVDWYRGAACDQGKWRWGAGNGGRHSRRLPQRVGSQRRPEDSDRTEDGATFPRTIRICSVPLPECP